MVQFHKESLAQEVQNLHSELTVLQAEMRTKEEKLRQERDQAQLKALKALKKLDKLQSAPKKPADSATNLGTTNVVLDPETVIQQNQAMRQ